MASGVRLDSKILSMVQNSSDWYRSVPGDAAKAYPACSPLSKLCSTTSESVARRDAI